MNKIPIFLLMLVGEILICMGAVLLLADMEPTNLLVLNVVVLSMIYLLIFATGFDLFNDVNIVGSSTSGLGLSMYGIWLYSLISICCIVASYVWRWNLPIAIMAQVGAFFVLFMFMIFSNKAVNNVEESLYTIENRKNSLKYAAELLNDIECQVKMNNGSTHYYAQDIDMLKEQLRYITFSDRTAAQDLDNKLIGAIKELIFLSNLKSNNNAQWGDAVERCNTIIKLRKQQL